MENVSVINGQDVQNLITKFYYNDNHLCFQILLYLGVEQTIPYKEFTDYAEYKKVYSELMTAKTSNQPISVPQSEGVLSNIDFA